MNGACLIFSLFPSLCLSLPSNDLTCHRELLDLFNGLFQSEF